jgi:hypothetical protein
MPNIPEMALTWDPATSGLNDILGGGDPRTVWAGRQTQLMKTIETSKGISFSALGYSYANLAGRAPFSVE